MTYRRYASYYTYIVECKNYQVSNQKYDTAAGLREIERSFFKDIKPVSQWYFEPDVEFDEIEFLRSLEKLEDKSIVRDFKIKMIENDAFWFNT
jgi:hypothetical protein